MLPASGRPSDGVVHGRRAAGPGSAVTYVAGIVHVRGRVVPVVDLRVRFGLPPIELSLDSRVVVVELAERTVGLLADSAGAEVVKPPSRRSCRRRRA